MTVTLFLDKILVDVVRLRIVVAYMVLVRSIFFWYEDRVQRYRPH